MTTVSKSFDIGRSQVINWLIALQFFPPYSPELNPMEWEWHELRRQATHTKRFQCNLCHKL